MENCRDKSSDLRELLNPVSDNEVDSDNLLDFSSGGEDNYCLQFEFDSDDSRANNRPERQIPRSESEGDVGLSLPNFSLPTRPSDLSIRQTPSPSQEIPHINDVWLKIYPPEPRQNFLKS
ncbi:hypothetical protein J6590_093500 [Homalodisca vitripennis]|nr:hypothetical protein J6590_093500 [Homalodisca vitripennis]